MTQKKAPTFTSLLEQDFRWPTTGDQLFAPSSEFMGDAIVVDDTTTRLVLMASGYKEAADLLVERATHDRASRDFLVYPIIFCYRHFLELILKQTLALHGASVGIPANWSSHDILELWESVFEMYRRFGAEDSSKADPVVMACITEFSKIDPVSFSFRYPTNKKGEPLPLALERLDLLQLRDVMTALSNYFDGVDGYLTELGNAAPYAEHYD